MLARMIFLLQSTVGIENVTLSRIALRYYRDSVTVILTAPPLQTYVMSRAVTKQIVTQSRRLVEFSVSKWLKLTQFHLFTHSLIDKCNFAKRKSTRSTKNEPLCIGRIEASTCPPPPLGQPPGHLTFLKIIVQIPPYPAGQNAVQMPHGRVR